MAERLGHEGDAWVDPGERLGGLVRPAGGEEDRHRRAELPEPGKRALAAEPRHVHVQDHRVRPQPALQQGQRLLAAGGRGDIKPPCGRERRHGPPDQLVVVHQQHMQPAGCRERPRAALAGRVLGLRFADRKAQHHLGAAARLAPDLHLAVVGIDGAVDHGEPQPGALPHLLGGEEGIHRLVQHLLGHAGPGVLHMDLGPPASGVPGAQGERASLGHRIHGVDAEVHEGVGQEAPVPPDRPQGGIQLQLEADPGEGRALEQPELLAQHQVQVQFAHLPRTLAGQPQQALHHLPAPGGGLGDHVEGPPGRAVRILLLALGGGCEQDGPQDVVHVVGHPAGQLPQALHLLGLDELGLEPGLLLLGPLALRDILDDSLEVQRVARGIPDEARALPEGDHLAAGLRPLGLEAFHLRVGLQFPAEALHIVGGIPLQPAVGQLLEAGVAEHPAHGLVGHHDAPLHGRPVEPHHRVLEEAGQALPGARLRMLRPLLIGDVPPDAVVDLGARRPDVLHGHMDVPELAALGALQGLEVVVALGHDAAHMLQGAGGRLLGFEIGEAEPRELRPRIAQLAAGLFVEVDDARGGRIEDHDAVLAVFEEGPVAGSGQGELALQPAAVQQQPQDPAGERRRQQARAQEECRRPGGVGKAFSHREHRRYSPASRKRPAVHLIGPDPGGRESGVRTQPGQKVPSIHGRVVPGLVRRGLCGAVRAPGCRGGGAGGADRAGRRPGAPLGACPGPGLRERKASAGAAQDEPCRLRAGPVAAPAGARPPGAARLAAPGRHAAPALPPGLPVGDLPLVHPLRLLRGRREPAPAR